MPLSQRVSDANSVSLVSPLAYPLDEFYSEAGLRLPAIEAVEGPNVPEPYQTLLVHRNDMTPTLQGFYEGKVRLEVLGRKHQLNSNSYSREVLLRLESTGAPVEFGAIKIYLNLFPPAARRHILEEKFPLGRILSEHEIVHTSRPKAFLRVQADELICSHLGLTGSPWLFGRRNTLSDTQSRPLAEIVEILPPAAKTKP